MRKCLVVNQGYIPLVAVSWQRGVCLLYRGRAELLEAYSDWSIRSAHAEHPTPAVLRLPHWSRQPPHHTKLCRENVFIRDELSCQYCGRTAHPRTLTFDHIVPKSRGGKTTWTNIVTACRKCNNRKADKTLAQARMTLLSTPREPNPHEMRISFIIRDRDNVPDEWVPWLNMT